LDISGQLDCWGYDTDGQVSSAPSGTGYVDVTVGEGFSCAVDSVGAIECWGNDYYGQVSNIPVFVPPTDTGDTDVWWWDSGSA
jgi:hypothetical protein